IWASSAASLPLLLTPRPKPDSGFMRTYSAPTWIGEVTQRRELRWCRQRVGRGQQPLQQASVGELFRGGPGDCEGVGAATELTVALRSEAVEANIDVDSAEGL